MKEEHMGQPRQAKARSITRIGLIIALLAAAAQIQVPVGPVPFTLQSMVVMAICMVFSPAEALLSIGGYLLAGAIGLPVGAGFRGGPAWLAGPTGGFLMGFMAAAALTAAIKRLAAANTWLYSRQAILDACVGVAAMAAYYCCGVGWLMASTGVRLTAALSFAVLPFLLPDIAKLVAALACARSFRSATTGMPAKYLAP
jgi:biotin transport system substrate-specific component